MSKLAYNEVEAAAEVGLSPSTIKRAIQAGELKTVTPKIDGKQVRKNLVLHTDLVAWITGTKAGA